MHCGKKIKGNSKSSGWKSNVELKDRVLYFLCCVKTPLALGYSTILLFSKIDEMWVAPLLIHGSGWV